MRTERKPTQYTMSRLTRWSTHDASHNASRMLYFAYATLIFPTTFRYA
jgi:hypothetical protein